MKRTILGLLIVGNLFSNCTKDVADTTHLGSNIADFKTYQYDVGGPAGIKYIWRHFKWENNRLMFDSIPNRFQFEETRTEKIADFRAFTERFPIILSFHQASPQA